MINLVAFLQSWAAARKNDDEGATMIEYALLAFLISIAAIAVLPGVGDKVLSTFTAVKTALGG